MADTGPPVGPQEWPNQRLKIIIPTWTMCAISTGFMLWRCVYGLTQKRKFLTSDYLLIIATALNIAASSTNQVVVDNGQGRHIMDPSVFPHLRTYSYYLWQTQILNILAVAFLKWAICAWLLVLNFSRLYQGIVWLSIAMVTAFNFLAPIITLFGCAPLEKNWNFGFKGKGHCWARGTLPLSYTQGISSIITDIVYMAAPLIYISRVQLSKRTQMGIRIVFLLSIPATVCSIFKTVELNNITKTRDPTWDGVALGIWSSGEASIGILIASLPPLRKPFDYLFSKFLPSTFTGSAKTPTSSYRPTGGRASIHLQNLSNSKAYRSRIPGESVLDDESDCAILDEEHKAGGIIKSTDVEVRVSSDIIDGSSDSKGSPSPRMMKHPSVDWRLHMQSGPGPQVPR